MLPTQKNYPIIEYIEVVDILGDQPFNVFQYQPEVISDYREGVVIIFHWSYINPYCNGSPWIRSSCDILIYPYRYIKH